MKSPLQKALDPNVFKNLDIIAKEAVKWKNAKHAMSITDLLKGLYMALNNNQPEYYRIPDSKEILMQLLFLHQNVGIDDHARWINSSDNVLRLSVLMDSTHTLEEQIHQIKNLAIEILPEEAKVTISCPFLKICK